MRVNSSSVFVCLEWNAAAANSLPLAVLSSIGFALALTMIASNASCVSAVCALLSAVVQILRLEMSWTTRMWV